MRDPVVEPLADDDAGLGDAWLGDAVLAVDETGFLKRAGRRAAWDARTRGSAGRIANGRIGVWAAYVSGHGHAFVERALSLPKAWTGDPARLRAAPGPADVGFATKPALAMIRRAMEAGRPFARVAAGSVCGLGDVGQALRRAGKGYGLGVTASSPFSSWIGKPEAAGTAAPIAEDLDPAAWQRLAGRHGHEGRAPS